MKKNDDKCSDEAGKCEVPGFQRSGVLVEYNRTTITRSIFFIINE